MAMVTGVRPAVSTRPGNVARRLGRFVVERFPPVGHGTLVVALVLCGRAIAALAAGLPLRVGWDLAGAVAAAALAFLALRALDEIRDEADDRIGRPDRPLPRGLVTVPELEVLAAACAIGGAGIAAAIGSVALGVYSLLVAQILVLGWAARPGTRERGRGLARSHGLSAALIHSGIVPTGLLLGWTTGGPIAWGPHLWSGLLLAWGAGLALEVGRKTLRQDEERDGIETYSAELGRSRALALTAAFLSAAAGGALLLTLATPMPPGVAGVPLGAVVASAAAVATAALDGGRRLRTEVVRVVVPVAVLLLLLWPIALFFARGPIS